MQPFARVPVAVPLRNQAAAIRAGEVADDKITVKLQRERPGWRVEQVDAARQRSSAHASQQVVNPCGENERSLVDVAEFGFHFELVP